MIAITFSIRSSTRRSAASIVPTCSKWSSSELVFEAERVEERAQPRVVVRAEAFVGAERLGIRVSGLPKMLRQQVLVRHVVGHLAQAVHVVGEGDEPRLHLVVGQHAEGVPHHGGARDLAERADVRQAGRAVAGLEHHLVLRCVFEPRDDRSPARTARHWIVRQASADRSGWRQGREWTSVSPRPRKLALPRQNAKRRRVAVIPGRCETSNFDVRLHIRESRDFGSGASAPFRNDCVKTG